jgi:CHAT domain-containing protein
MAAGAALLLASPAQATCDRGPIPSPWPAAAPLAERYAALAAQDLDGPDADRRIREWQALIAAAEGDARVPQQILVRSLTWQAYLQGGLDNAASKAAMDRAMALAARAPDPEFDAVRLANASMVAVVFGKLDEAQALLKAAQTAPHTGAGERSVQAYWEAIARNFLAWQKGDGATSLAASRDMVALAEACLPERAAATLTAMSNLGAALDASGRQEESLAAQEHAVVWGLEHVDESSAGLATAINNYGVDLRNSGRFAEAVTVLRHSIDLFAKYQATNLNQRATALGNLAAALDYQGQTREAEALWVQALEWFEKAPQGDFISPVVTKRSAADAVYKRGDRALALQRLREAAAYAEAHLAKDSLDIALTRMHLADVLALEGQVAEAMAIAEPADARVRAAMPEDSLRRMSSELIFGRVVAKARGAAAGVAASRPVLARLSAKLLATDSNARQRIRYRSLVLGSFIALAQMALDAGDTQLAFEVLQLISISEITTAEAQSFARRASDDPRTAEHLFAYQQAVTARQALAAKRNALGAEDRAGRQDLNAAILAADEDVTRREAELAARLPDFLRRTHPALVDLATFRAGLAPDQVVIIPLVSDSRATTVAITREGLFSASGGAARDYAAAVRQVRASIDAYAAAPGRARFDGQAARRLYTLLFPPALRPVLTAHPNLLYVPRGVLAELPLGLLIAPGRTASGKVNWLVRSHAITVLSGLSMRRTESLQARSPDLAFLGVGDPVIPPAAAKPTGSLLAVRSGQIDVAGVVRLAALPGAAAELHQLSAALATGGAVVLTGAGATRRSLNALELGRFRVIAFATHGLAPSESGRAGEAALVMSSEGEAPDLLTASEIAQWQLNADWVILSACNSAAGSEPGAPQLSGLASAFVRAGARNLLVSSWPLRDDAAARLTVATVQGAERGLPRPEALRRAMLDLLDDPELADAAHPAVWAALSLVSPL